MGGLYVNGDQSINESRSKVVKVDMFFVHSFFVVFFVFCFSCKCKQTRARSVVVGREAQGTEVNE